MAEQNLATTVSAFQNYVKRMKQLDEAIALIAWDMRTGAPKKGIEQRSEVLGMLSGDLFRMSISQEMGQFLAELSKPEVLEKLDPITRASVEDRKREYDRSQKIPPAKYEAYVTLCSKAEYAWQEARENNDFASFQPLLEQIVATLGEFIELWGYKDNKYDTLLDQYEPGMTVAKLDQIFAPLRERTVQLVKAIGQVRKPRTDFLFAHYPKAEQMAFSKYLLRQMGYDFDAGRIDESAHPFATGLNPGDVRVTTRFKEDELTYSLFSTVHEGGHALYEQNLSLKLLNTFLCTGTSMGIHESQSRFWENMIGRSEEFWTRFYSDLQAAFPKQLDGVTLEEFHKAVNVVEPSLVRTEADELTYNLHIMIRYEIEKDLINGVIQVKDLPDVWNQKMEEYLGITPTDYANGVLQDIHWSGGAFGYFPSYSLGNIYAAQIEHALRQAKPDYKEKVKQGDLGEIKAWLTEKVYQYGKAKTPGEIMKATTGEEINAEYLITYLEEKYKKVYGLES